MDEDQKIDFPPGYFETLGRLSTSIYAHPTDCAVCGHREYLHDDAGCNGHPPTGCGCTGYTTSIDN